MKNSVLILLLITLILSCTNKGSENSLKSDLTLKEYYSIKEIDELDKILAYVDNEIIKIDNNKDLNKAYHDFFENLKSQMNDSISISSIIDEKDKYSFLQTIDTNVFNSIFTFQDTLGRLLYKDTVLTNFTGIRMLNIQPHGRYVKYLKRLGETTNQSYIEIASMIEMAGDFSASFVSGYPNVHSKFDFRNKTERLFAAIFILRLEDNYNNKLKRYFDSINATQHTI